MERIVDAGGIRGRVKMKGAPLVIIMAVVAVQMLLLAGELGRHDRHGCGILLLLHVESDKSLDHNYFMLFQVDVEI